MKEKIQLRAIDFKGGEYASDRENPCKGCAIERALHRDYGFPYVDEFVSRVWVGGDIQTAVMLPHESYTMNMFGEDFAKAKRLNFSNAIIRTIELKP
jgi:hypothetical protein